MKDAIERSIWIAASPDAVWAALVDAGEFGTWFRARAEGPFEAGSVVWLEMTQEGFEGMRFWIRPVVLDPPLRFAFDWPASDTPAEEDPDRSQTTRVTFDLADENGGTRVSVTESGFAVLPPDIAERKYPENTQGWEIQLQNLRVHVAP
jgi:uncharacterized protein YndB with AHSA1/START domain